MGDFTVYMDESGLFSPARDNIHYMGERVMAALILPGTDDSNRIEIEPLLSAAARGLVPFHASECRSRLREGNGQQDGRRLKDQASAIIVNVRQWLHEHLRDRKGQVVLCYEHGDIAPRPHRWLPMAHATLSNALVQIALTPGGPHKVSLVPSIAFQHTQVDLSDTIVKLNLAGRHLEIIRTRPVAQCVAARSSAGIQLADVMAHAMGPRSAQDTWYDPNNRLDLQELRERAAREFGLSDGFEVPMHACGALLETHGELQAALKDLSTGPENIPKALAHRVARIQEFIAKPTPPNTPLCALEGTLRTIEALLQRVSSQPRGLGRAQ